VGLIVRVLIGVREAVTVIVGVWVNVGVSVGAGVSVGVGVSVSTCATAGDAPAGVADNRNIPNTDTIKNKTVAIIISWAKGLWVLVRIS
jgi:hypothetical protein